MSTPQYELLRESITDADCQIAFHLLLDHIGYENRISIEDIAQVMYGSRRDTATRKARDVVELLRSCGIAVCSSSGKSGRWLASTEEEKEECLADFYARRSSIDAVIKALEKAVVPPPAGIKQVIQASLF